MSWKNLTHFEYGTILVKVSRHESEKLTSIGSPVRQPYDEEVQYYIQEDIGLPS